MKFFDSHCHLDLEPLCDDAEGAIERAYKANVSSMINIGATLSHSEKSVEIANLYPNIWASVGIHPHDAEELLNIEESINKLRELSLNDKVVAIGEIGLDYFNLDESHSRESGNLDSWVDSKNDIITRQKDLFIAQLELAGELKLPVVIHTRKAEEDTLKILKDWVIKYKPTKVGVIHCYTGSKEFAQKFLDLGFYLGFTGFVTFEQEKFNHIRESVKIVPIGKLLIETDAPYLAPEPYRGKTNEPAFVVEVAKKIAEIKEVSIEEIANVTDKNTKTLFNIK